MKADGEAAAPVEEAKEVEEPKEDHKEEETVSINPVPASEGAQNEPTVDIASTEDHVKLDKEAYESTEPSVPQDLVEEPAKEVEEPKEESKEEQTLSVNPIPASNNA